MLDSSLILNYFSQHSANRSLLFSWQSFMFKERKKLNKSFDLKNHIDFYILQSKEIYLCPEYKPFKNVAHLGYRLKIRNAWCKQTGFFFFFFLIIFIKVMHVYIFQPNSSMIFIVTNSYLLLNPPLPTLDFYFLEATTTNSFSLAIYFDYYK